MPSFIFWLFLAGHQRRWPRNIRSRRRGIFSIFGNLLFVFHKGHAPLPAKMFALSPLGIRLKLKIPGEKIKVRIPFYTQLNMTSIALLSALRKNRPLSCIVSKMNLETMKWIFSSCKGSFLYQGWGSRRSCGWKSENPSSSHLQWPFSNINNSRKPRVEISFKNQMIFCI